MPALHAGGTCKPVTSLPPAAGYGCCGVTVRLTVTPPHDAVVRPAEGCFPAGARTARTHSVAHQPAGRRALSAQTSTRRRGRFPGGQRLVVLRAACSFRERILWRADYPSVCHLRSVLHAHPVHSRRVPRPARPCLAAFFPEVQGTDRRRGLPNRGGPSNAERQTQGLPQRASSPFASVLFVICCSLFDIRYSFLCPFHPLLSAIRYPLSSSAPLPHTRSRLGLSSGLRPTFAISTHCPCTFTRTTSAVKSVTVLPLLLNRCEPTA